MSAKDWFKSSDWLPAPKQSTRNVRRLRAVDPAPKYTFGMREESEKEMFPN